MILMEYKKEKLGTIKLTVSVLLSLKRNYLFCEVRGSCYRHVFYTLFVNLSLNSVDARCA
jgi:hypothetical protein